MNHVQLDYAKGSPFIGSNDLSYFQDAVCLIHDEIHGKNGPGHKSLGWIDYPIQYDVAEIKKIKQAASKVIGDSDILLVIGIGGSYMGARAAIEMLTHSFYNHLPKEQRVSPQIFYVGNNLSSIYMSDLLDLLQERDFSINVISKSGNTLEPSIAFRIFRKLLEEKYGKQGSRARIYVTTDRVKGSLKAIATTEGYETFVIPEDIGGRYSVLTAVGLFPIAVSGVSIDEILSGSAAARAELNQWDVAKNAAYEYATIRNVLYNKGKTIELLVSYEPSFKYFMEWWKQLFAESEGKNLKGIFPTSAIYSTDLHSIGQYVQEGRRDLFETIIKEEMVGKELVIEKEIDNFDNLNYLSGKTVNFVKEQAFTGALQAHTDGGVPNLIIRIPEITPFTFGYLIYFFQKACVMSGYLHGVNPFNQPGVEAYKKNMKVLLSRQLNRKEKV